MDAHERVVRSYYEYVDEGDYETMFDLFADDITYERPGQGAIEGTEAFRRFYREERPLADGDHELHDIVVGDDTVAVRGTFCGRQDGQQVELGFADLHVFNDERRISHRYTYTDRDTV